MALPAVTCTFQLTPKDYYRARLGNILRRWQLYPISIVFFLMMTWVIEGTPMVWGELLPTLYDFFAILIAYFGVIVVGNYLTALSQFKSSKGLQQPMTFTFSEHGIEVRSATAQSRTDWSNVYRVTETKPIFLIYPSKAIFWMIPRRAFTEESSVVTLRQLIRDHVKGKIKLRG